MEYLFWSVISTLIIAWYIIVTVIVTIKGAVDIKELMKELKEKNDTGK